MKKRSVKDTEKRGLYLMPGMAASPRIFEFINLSEFFEVVCLSWIIPEDEESIADYAKRMCLRIQHKDPILLGVSFGGILVQEMAKHISCDKVVVVSSVKSFKELPLSMILSKKTNAHKLLPTQWVKNLESLAFFVFGSSIERKVGLYQKYLSERDPKYLKWAIHTLVNWEQEVFDPEVIHIHGKKDTMFPFKNIIKTSYLHYLPQGAHAMILAKHQWFNTELPKLLF
jgi:pimeloyl-ACP methyl ester carboxylesterase